ncbi:hypothetical protein EJB05_13340, partial [Eragrostis curvula]
MEQASFPEVTSDLDASTLDRKRQRRGPAKQQSDLRAPLIKVCSTSVNEALIKEEFDKLQLNLKTAGH